MPAHDGSRSDQNERLRPPGPERSQCDPKQLVQGSQSTARSLACRASSCLTESQVFEDETLPGTESADHPPQEIPEQHDHGKNLIGTNPNSAFGQVTHFAGVRYFGETQVSQYQFEGFSRMRTDNRAAQLGKSLSASPISATMMALSASESIRAAIRKTR